MNWKVVVAVGAVAGAVIWAAARRRVQQTKADGALWAEATDPVIRFGDS